MSLHLWHTQQTVGRNQWSASKKTTGQVNVVATQHVLACNDSLQARLGCKRKLLILYLHACIDNTGASDHIRSRVVVYNALQAINAPAVQ